MDSGFPSARTGTRFTTSLDGPPAPRPQYERPSQRELLLQNLGRSPEAERYFDDDAKAEQFVCLTQVFGAKKRTAIAEFFQEYRSLFDEQGKPIGSTKLVRNFIERRDKHGNRPIRNAIARADNALVIWLLQNGAQPSANALTAAIDSSLDEQAFRALLTAANRRGVNLVNAFDSQGFTPLTLAVHREAHDRIDLLLACCPKLDLNQPDKRGNTPLNLAAAKGSYGIVYRLLTARADATRESADHHSPLVTNLQFWDDKDVMYGLIFEALLEVLKGMMDKGGVAKDKASAVLGAAHQEAASHGQEWQKAEIEQILKPVLKGM